MVGSEGKTSIFDIIQLIMDEAEHNEGAKIAALMIVERFAENDTLREAECTRFWDIHLAEI